MVKKLGYGLSPGFAIISGMTWTSDPIASSVNKGKEGKLHLHHTGLLCGALSTVPGSHKYSINSRKIFKSH